MSGTDRHKTPRLYHSGAKKRKEAKQCSEKEAEVMSKTQRLTEFMTQVPQSDSLPSSSSVTVPEEIVHGVNTEEQIEMNTDISDTAEKVDDI